MRKYLLSFAILFTISFFLITKAQAKEGTIELKNVNGSAAQCFGMFSGIDRTTTFQLLIQCKRLIYPIEPEGKFYILWANPGQNDASPLRLGELEFGKVTFRTNRDISGLFVTKEQIKSPREPSENRVMEGTIEAIPFLETTESPSVITETPEKPQVSEESQKSPVPSNIIQIAQTIVVIILIIATLVIIIYIIYRIRKALTRNQ